MLARSWCVHPLYTSVASIQSLCFFISRPCSQCPCFKTRILPVVYYYCLLNARLSIVFVISVCVWHVISKVTIYIRGIGFQFIVASLCFSLILKLDPWAVKYKLKAEGNTILESLLLVLLQTNGELQCSSVLPCRDEWSVISRCSGTTW